MNLLTLDIDWAPEAVIEDCLELLDGSGLRCTIFATHPSAALARCDRKRFEIGIHPNFNPLLFEGAGGGVDKVLDDILTLFPEAKGVRSHSMTQNTPLLDRFKAKGMIYEANHFLPYWEQIKPYRLWNGLLRIPYNWEDDIHFVYQKSFDRSGLDLSGGAFNVLDFHPVHIYLNTENEARYQAAKKEYQNPAKLIEFRNTSGRAGTRDLFLDVLRQMKESKESTRTLAEVADQFLKTGR